MFKRMHKPVQRALVGLITLGIALPGFATTPLSDRPVFAAVSVPGNLALTVSVEFPTAISVAHPNRTYASTTEYIGYFDPNKCYVYQHTSDTNDGLPSVYTAGTSDDNYFVPSGKTTDRKCTGKWSGNFLNWATMQTIDPFRWALSGGYRVIDTASLTVLEKAWSPNQGSDSNFPSVDISNNAVIKGATPFDKARFRSTVRTYGNKLRFITGEGGSFGSAPTVYKPSISSPTDGTTYDFFVRVKVCDPSLAAGGVEANCTDYPAGNYKPTGLLQGYSDRIRYSVFGYLNDSAVGRDGGVLRAQQKFIGIKQPVPGGLPISTANPEWDENTGVMFANPNASEASDTATKFGVTVTNSGVMNYLNKFGQITPGNFKTYDPVGELYYAAIRYFKKQGNVAAWTDMGSASAATKATYVDGFPVITDWKDPILYACQNNFILGIGDVNTHADRNLPGATGSSEPAKPSEVAADSTVDALKATNKVGSLHGLGASIGATQNYGGCCTNNGALMAGLAYDANTKDIRPDLDDRQSVQTYWLDVLEYGTYKKDNQFYLATKYGGFTVPPDFDPYARSTDIATGWWRTNSDTVGSGGTSQPRPDNYFTAARADQMVAGLSKAFASIASKLDSFSSAFASALPQVELTGSASYASSYSAKSWTGELTASSVVYDADTGVPVLTEAWKFSSKLEAQAAAGGWASKRFIASYDTATKKGVPFTTAKLPSGQLALLDTAYRTSADSADYLAYLRGDRTHEVSSIASGSAKSYRDRGNLVGDIVNSRLRPVASPNYPYADSANAGYSKFKSDNKTRPTMVYFGTNQGMVHGVNGELTGASAGKEIFAYVPSMLFAGPTGEPAKNGLQSLGNPDFVHYNQVDARPMSADVDFGRTGGSVGLPDWRSVLIGGLGKGGKGFYALDITNPSTISSDDNIATRVLWEFTHPNMGYSFGEPVVVKTKKYGWTVFLSSGHNNSDGKGYIFVVNPKTGELLEPPISTGEGSSGSQAGLAQMQAFIPDVTDGLADALYAGDLLGNLWRLDLTKGSGSYAAPTKIAKLTDASGDPLPVTAKPLIVVQPGTLTRWVTVGSGKLLDSSDITNKQAHRFFAIMDGVNAKFWQPTELPSGFTYPITTSKLKKLTDITKKVVLDYSKEIGWFIELGAESTAGWRVISESASYQGIVAFSSMVPTSSDVCKPSGTSRVYAIDLGTGSSTLTKSTTGYDTSMEGVVVDVSIRSVAGKPRLYVGDNKGKQGTPEANLGAGNKARRMNWREVPLTR